MAGRRAKLTLILLIAGFVSLVWLADESFAQRRGRGGENPLPISPEQLQVIPDSPTGGAVIRNSVRGLEDLQDNPDAKVLEFDVKILHLLSEKPIPEANQPLQAGMLAKLQETWQNAGVIDRSSDLRLSAVEGKMGTTVVGQEMGFVNGYTITAGRTNPNISRQQEGSTVRCQGRVRSDGRIILQLEIEQSWFQPAAPGASTTDLGDGLSITLPDKRLSSLNQVIIASPGTTELAHVSWTYEGKRHRGAIVAITPRVK